MLGGFTAPAVAQTAPATAQQPTAPSQPAGQAAEAAVQPATPVRTIRSVSVNGNQRLEVETVLSYTALRPGEPYDNERLDQALRDLLATELFADVQIGGVETGDIVIEVRENPVINRIILEGNRRLKDDKITPEIRLAPRQIFTRSRARADVARIIELYRRQGRYAARVEPQIVELDQNRVDVVFEIDEGPKSKVRQINIIGNEQFGDGDLISEMATRESRWWNIFSSADTYDPDRLAFDQQKLRQFYLTQGYADFRVVSAVAELTPDRRDFIITYVVEEGDRYRFGDVSVQSDIRDFAQEDLQRSLPMEAGDWYNAQLVEDTVTSLNELAGLFGYAFADVRPQFARSRENLTMGVTFRVAETPRVYVERIDVTGNTNTHDKVVRREFRLAEGDPFNNVRVSRSRDRIQSLGFFQDDLEITQEQGSAPDRVILGVAVEERATGELQFSAGFSSLERFLVNLSIRQRNFR
ncbi:MAG: outer membrane protein assembly factor BamA, partial [Allosphingosinicella sp.]